MDEAPDGRAGGQPGPEAAGEGAPTGAPLRSLAVTGLLVLALFYTLYFARPVLLPLVLALLLNFLLAPAVRGLKRLRVPEPVGAGLVILGFVGAVAAGGYQLSAPAAEWVERAPESLRRIEYKLRDLRRPMEQVSRATQEVRDLARIGEEGNERTVAVARPTLTDTLLSQTQEFLAGAVVLIALLYFLLASGDLFLRKLVRVIPRLQDKKRAVEIARQTERDISTYLYTITLINAILGGVVAFAMHWLAMPNPILWGVLAGLLNFVPYLGAMATTAVLAMVALLTFDELPRALLVPGVFVLLNLLEAYLLTPALLGRRLTLNTVVVFVGIIFWGWLWGIPGAILAVPILAATKILCDRVERLQPVGEFLGR